MVFNENCLNEFILLETLSIDAAIYSKSKSQLDNFDQKSIKFYKKP